MRSNREQRTHNARLFVVIATAVAVGLVVSGGLAGCTASNASRSVSATASAISSPDTTPGQFPERKPARAVAPDEPELGTPEEAVASYLAWTSYAYRILNSDVASMTFDPNEEVRVNSYVELNREKGRSIDQRLIGFVVTTQKTGDPTATVSAAEQWVYRYVNTSTGLYESPVHNASYDATYTVVLRDDGTWVVANVEATPVGGAVK